MGHDNKVSRRTFLMGLGAAVVGATAAACGRRSALIRPSTPVASPIPSLLAGPTLPATAQSGQTGTADLVLRNGKVITVDATDSIAQAIAVQGERILAAGSNEEIDALAGAGTQIVDLAGRAVTPGLIDPHNHFQVMGLMNTAYTSFIPPEVKTIADMQARLADIAAQKGEGEWIQGYYLAVQEGRPPNRYDLDKGSADHPVWMIQQGGHFGAANSLALQIAGITAGTTDPVGGIIERDSQGEPTGVFYNHRAMDLLRRNIPAISTDSVRDNILSTMPLFAACGVTSFQDNNVRGVDTINTYLDVGRQGEMYLRGAVYYTLEWPQDLERALNELEQYSDPHMRFAGFKFLIDGQAPTAYCHEPHNGVSWQTTTWEPNSFKEAVRALHDTGLQICVHCVGDAAVDLTLDAYEEAMNANPRPDPRHRIEHCVLCTPEATQRMKDLGVVVSTQPQFIRVGGEGWTNIFGAERVRRAIVTREWLDAGVHLALGSDAPTTPWYTPQVTLAGAVSRITYSGKVLEPDQCLTIQEALRAHTMGAAYAGHEETTKGSIEAGKLADLAVWSEDPYTAPLERLWKIPIDMTIVAGKMVYEA